MSFLKVLQKVEHIILGDNSENIKPKDHWKKYRRPKNQK